MCPLQPPSNPATIIYQCDMCCKQVDKKDLCRVLLRGDTIRSTLCSECFHRMRYFTEEFRGDD